MQHINYPQLSDGNVVSFGHGSHDFQRNARLVVLQSQGRSESRCLSHGDVSNRVQFLPQIHSVPEGLFGVLPIARGKCECDRMFRIASSLHLTRFDQVEQFPHFRVETVLVEQVAEDLVGGQLIEKAAVFFILEQLECQGGVLHGVQGTHDHRSKDVVAETQFRGLGVVPEGW